MVPSHVTGLDVFSPSRRSHFSWRPCNPACRRPGFSRLSITGVVADKSKVFFLLPFAHRPTVWAIGSHRAAGLLTQSVMEGHGNIRLVGMPRQRYSRYIRVHTCLYPLHRAVSASPSQQLVYMPAHHTRSSVASLPPIVRRAVFAAPGRTMAQHCPGLPCSTAGAHRANAERCAFFVSRRLQGGFY